MAHRHLDTLLTAQGAAIDAYYYCPHHPDGVVAAYTRACDCRKPAPGMIARAALDLDIDVAGSFVVGDKWLDIELAQRAGATAVPCARVRPVGGNRAARPYSSRGGGRHAARRSVLDSRAIAARIVEELIWRSLLQSRARPRSACWR